MTSSERLSVQSDGHRSSRPLRPSIPLTDLHQDLIDRLVEATCRRTGETPEEVRRHVEIAVVTRGITALQEELGKA